MAVPQSYLVKSIASAVREMKLVCVKAEWYNYFNVASILIVLYFIKIIYTQKSNSYKYIFRTFYQSMSRNEEMHDQCGHPELDDGPSEQSYHSSAEAEGSEAKI